MRLTFTILILALAVAAPAQLLDSIKVNGTDDHFYSVYIPSGYNDSKSLPVIYFLEPAGRAAYVLDLYKDIAEEFGIILCSSYSVHNGPWDPLLTAMDQLLVETGRRYNIDNDQVYLSGFSGGSRAALSIAVLTNRIKGVIGCGAALPNNTNFQPSTRSPNHIQYPGCHS